MNTVSQIKQAIESCGFWETGYVDISSLVFYPEIRRLCEGNSCRNYGTSWACPPAVGTIEACRERISKYDTMLLFSKKYDLEDSFDFDAMADGWQDFKNITEQFHRSLKLLLPDYLLLSNEGCGKCTKCTYPDEACRFPDLLTHSLEGYGFLVSELTAQAGIHYHNGPNTVTYYGALLFRSDS